MDFDFQKGTKALTALERLFIEADLKGTSVDDVELLRLANEVYDAYAGEFRPIVAALPAFGEKVGNDIVPIFVALLKVWNANVGNADLQAEIAKANAASAKMRFASFRAHVEVGFTEEQAMAFVLQDAANTKSFSQAIGASIGQSIGKQGDKALENAPVLN